MPPDAGNGAEHAGLPLARLLWHLPPPALVSLIEALLLVCVMPNALPAALFYPSRLQLKLASPERQWSVKNAYVLI